MSERLLPGENGWRAVRATACLLLGMGLSPALLRAQEKDGALPNAPSSLETKLSLAQMINVPTQDPPAAAPKYAVAAQSPEAAPSLTRQQAEQMAIRNNPHISVSRLLARAQHQVVRETRAATLPQLTGSLTAMTSHDANRVASGSLSSSRLIEHAGGGVAMSQLITDFGRTSNLIAYSKLLEKAQDANALATTEDIVLATDVAFYNALQAETLLTVAQQTVATRQTTETQVSELTRNNLKSTLDLSFADVNLSQAKLLVLDAQNQVDAAMAALTEVLGQDTTVRYTLVEQNAQAPPPPTDAEALARLALQQRPDLQALGYNEQAAQRYSRAARDQRLPTVTALGTVGGIPVRPGQFYDSSWDGAIGVNVTVPIFNGFLYTAQGEEAQLRAQATAEQGRALRDQIVREVRTAWINANDAFQRIAVTAQLLNQANLALALSQTRYRLGLSSIVELSQAQLQQTQAAISNTNAEYQYRVALSALGYQTGSQP